MLCSPVDAHVVVTAAREHVPIVVPVQIRNRNVRSVLVDVSKLVVIAHSASRFCDALALVLDCAGTTCRTTAIAAFSGEFAALI